MARQIWLNQTTIVSDDKDTNPFSNVFDGEKSTTWISKNQISEGNPHTIELTFNGLKGFTAFVYHPFYNTQSSLRKYRGLPTELNVYASFNGKEELVYIIQNQISETTRLEYVLMEFPTTLWCSKLKLEIINVTYNQVETEFYAQAHDIYFVQDVPIPSSSGVQTVGDSYKENKVPTENYTISSSSVAQEGTSVDNLKTDAETFWAPTTELKDTTVNLTFEFNQIQGIESIVMEISQSGGFPYFVKVFTSSARQEFRLQGVFSNDPSTNSSGTFTFQFFRPIWCEQLTIEFCRATEASGYESKQGPKLQFIYFVQQDEAKSVLRGAPIDATYMTPTNQTYIDTYKITLDDVIATHTPGDLSGHLFRYTFDNSSNHWATSTVNTATFKNYAIYDFAKIECLQSILFTASYTSKTLIYFGFPYIFKIYASVNNASYELKYVFSGHPSGSKIWNPMEFRFPTKIWADNLKLEFEEVTYESFFKHDYAASAKSIFLMKKPKEETSPRLEINNTEETERSVTIENCTFSNLQDSTIEFGGSIFLTNCEVTCRQNEFTKSYANKGGGAIYINTKRQDRMHSFAFKDLIFTECSSGYGGAICVIALGTSDKVTVTSCEFHSNIANLPDFGGSSIFVATKSTSIKQCTFSGHSGKSSIVRYYKTDPENEGSPSRILSAEDLQLEISDCVFDKDIKVKSSIIEFDEKIDEKSITFKGNQFPSGAIKEIQIQETSTTKNRSGLLLEILIPSILSIVVLLIAIILIQKIRHNRHENESSQDTHNEP